MAHILALLWQYFAKPLRDATRVHSEYHLNLLLLCTHVCAFETFQRVEMNLICHVESFNGAHVDGLTQQQETVKGGNAF